MDAAQLQRLGGVCAIAGGALAIASRFMPQSIDVGLREALYFAVDVFFMFGVFAIYLHSGLRTGLLGFAGFVLAATGVGSIIGPDAKFGMIDQYLLGGTVFGIGMFVLAIALLRERRQQIAAICWILTVLLGVAAYAPALSDGARFASGIAFGLGFVFAGREILASLRTAG